MRLLHLDTAQWQAAAASRALSAAIVARLQAATPAIQLCYRDLAHAPLPRLSAAVLLATLGTASTALPAELQPGREAAAEFRAADALVIGATLHPGGPSPLLLAWLDCIALHKQAPDFKKRRIIMALPNGAGRKQEIVRLQKVLTFAGLSGAEIITGLHQLNTP